MANVKKSLKKSKKLLSKYTFLPKIYVNKNIKYIFDYFTDLSVHFEETY